MSSTKFKYFIGAVVFVLCINGVKAQGGLCPVNLDFELGDFTNWVCKWGTVSSPGGVNTVSLPNIGQIPGRHTIISAATAGTDPYGGFSELCPNGSGYSVRLGNSGGNHEAESISYTYTIPAGLTNFSMLFHYAVVLQDFNHQPYEKPRFQARITDLTTGAAIPCVNFDFVTSGSLPGFAFSPVNPSVLYKDWTPITINLNGFIGRTIQLEFITSDCVYNAHFGYAYIDVNTNCNGAISGTTICQGDNSVTLTAPFGFQSYEWYSDNTFSTVVSTTQTLLLNPAPPVGTVFPVIVTPYAGYGCKDTLYATISIAPKPVSNAGPDVSVCQFNTVQVGGASTAGYTYEWTPALLVSNSIISNPFASWTSPPGNNEFVVKTTDILTGCFSYDTTIVTTKPVDTAITVTGKKDFCVGEALATTLSLNNTSTAVQWHDAAGAIPGATGVNFQPATTGDYWAELSQGGCTDTTSIIAVTVHPLPLVSFTTINDSACLTNNSFQFTNASTAPDNAAMTYVWKFSDGNTLQTTDVTKTFLTKGTFNTELVATTAFGCKDSVNKDVYVLPNGTADFVWDSICLNRPVTFTNLSQENGSPQVNYNWDFNNGDPSYLVKNPPPVIYTTEGNVDVTLTLTALGCENDVQTATKTISANKQLPGIRYKEITVPQGSSKFIHIRDSLVGSNYTWRPQLQLSSYTTRYTEFYATGNDMEYKIDVADIHTCLTTDTILMRVLKKPGYYLPTAFTPNGDGLNDVVRPYLVGIKSLKSFSVFNRWGTLVFHSVKEGEGWNGKYKGADLDTGVYVWILEFVNNSNQAITEKGTITLIR